MFEKYAVVVEESNDKTASDKNFCSRCGSPITRNSNIKLCDHCGSTPFEKQVEDTMRIM